MPQEEAKKGLSLLRIVRWAEAQQVPNWCLRKRRREREEQELSSISTTGTKDDDDTVFIIAGLERVLYGTQPAAEVVRVMGLRSPRYLCYMVSGSVCDILQFAIDAVLYSQFHLDASLCWMVSFGTSIVFRHTTHRYLVFGDYVGGYWKSLGRMYAGYSVIIVLSTIFNLALAKNKYFAVDHTVAWIVTLLWTGIVNYFILKKLWSFGKG